jgi:hypothetical protein
LVELLSFFNFKGKDDQCESQMSKVIRFSFCTLKWQKGRLLRWAGHENISLREGLFHIQRGGHQTKAEGCLELFHIFVVTKAWQQSSNSFFMAHKSSGFLI